MSGKRTKKETMPAEPVELPKMPAEPVELPKMRAKGMVNLREGPGFNFEVIRILNAEETVFISQNQKENGFIRVADKDGTEGWACCRYLLEA